MVEWNDRTTIAQLSFPDMKLPIQYALTYPDRIPGPCAPMDFTRMTQMTFEELDKEQFPALRLARRQDPRARPILPFSALPTKSLSLRFGGTIRFVDIAAVVESARGSHPIPVSSLDVVPEADHWARNITREIISGRTYLSTIQGPVPFAASHARNSAVGISNAKVSTDMLTGDAACSTWHKH